MDQYLLNIIPRLKRYTKDLNKTEVFVDKSWIFVDEKGNNHEYVFMRDGRLHMIYNGDTVTGSRELLPTGKLLINHVTNQITLENAFVDDAIMILQKSGSTEKPFMLVNQAKIPDGDILSYLEEKEHLYICSDSEKPSEPFLRANGILLYKAMLTKGMTVKTHDGSLTTGIFRTSVKEIEQYVKVDNKIISDIYYRTRYILQDSRTAIVLSDSPDSVTKGQKVENYAELNFAEDKKIKLWSKGQLKYTIRVDKSGIITYVKDADAAFILVLVLIMAALIIFSAAVLRINS